MKTCTRCGVEKEVTDFHKHSGTKDGVRSQCKECTCAGNRLRAAQHPEWRRSYPATERTKASRKAYLDRVPGRRREKRRQYRQRYPEKNRTVSAVSLALRKGKLLRPVFCTVCGGSGILHAHHEDYSKPLDVVWACIKCHDMLHGRTKVLLGGTENAT